VKKLEAAGYRRLQVLPGGLEGWKASGEAIEQGAGAVSELYSYGSIQAQLDIDRTLWGAVYGSSKFFGRLGQHLVNDVVHLFLKMVTKERPAG
jgi:hypothetical protein